jgi:enoyl-CoA hydratase
MGDRDGDVILEQKDQVAILTLEAPDTRNALTSAMGIELTLLCERVNADETVGAVVVRGSGGTFCSGANTSAWGLSRTDPAGEEGFALTSQIYSGFVSVMNLRVPTVAAVRGAAVGAGLNLALATDLRVIAEDARLLAGFLKIGVHPGGGFFSLISRASSWQTAAALGIFGQSISGARAVELGLAWEAVPDAEVESRALELARMASSDAMLTRRAKASMTLELGPPAISLSAALEVERGQQMWSQRRLATEAPDRE